MGNVLMLCLLVFSLYKWTQNKKSISFLFFLFCVCAGFRLIPAGLHTIKLHDYALIYLFSIIIYSFLKGVNIIRISNTIVDKLVLILLIYWIIIFLGTLLFTDEQPILAFQSFRFRLLFLVYFIIKDMSIQQKRKVMYYLFGIILFASILYVLQPLGIHIYQGGVEEALYSNEQSRYRNAPLFIQLFIILLAASNFITNAKLKLISISIFLIALIIPMSRTPIIMLFLVLITYMILSCKYKILFKSIFIISFALIICWPFLNYRFGATDTLGDIKSAVDFSEINNYDPNSSEGTFTFRMAMLHERITYLVNSNKILFGCGFIHEQSAYTRNLLNFRIGTINQINDELAITYLDTPDLTWLTILMRTGIIGVILILILIFTIFGFLKKSEKSFYKAISLWIIYLLLVSFSGDSLGFNSINNYVILFLTYHNFINKDESLKDKRKKYIY